MKTYNCILKQNIQTEKSSLPPKPFPPSLSLTLLLFNLSLSFSLFSTMAELDRGSSSIGEQDQTKLSIASNDIKLKS